MGHITKAIMYGLGDLRLEDHELRSQPLADHEIYIETLVTAFSIGTETGAYAGHTTDLPYAPDYPRWVGYNSVGRVAEVGSAVTCVRPGQRVFTRSPHQSAVLIEDNQPVVPIPENVADDQAALTFLACLGLMGLRDAQFTSGNNVAVVGLGIIGLASVSIARACGARRVIAVGNSEIRNEKALQVGAHEALMYNDPQLQDKILALTAPAGVDVVIHTANPWAAYKTAADIVGKRGRISVVGFPGRGEPPPDFNPLDPGTFYKKGFTLVPALVHPMGPCDPDEVRFTVAADCEFILQLIADGRVNFAALVTHRYPYDRMVEAFDLAATHDKSMIGCIFIWNQE